MGYPGSLCPYRGNFNAKHTDWGWTKTYQRGSSNSAECENQRWELMNKPVTATRIGGKSEQDTTLDLT